MRWTVWPEHESKLKPPPTAQQRFVSDVTGPVERCRKGISTGLLAEFEVETALAPPKGINWVQLLLADSGGSGRDGRLAAFAEGCVRALRRLH